MLRNIARGYRTFLGSAAKVLLLAAICALLAVALVLPLWKWASASPRSYTAAILTLAALMATALAVRSFRRAGAARFFVRVAKLLVLAAGIAGIFFFVFRGNVPLAAGVLVVAFILYSVLAFWAKPLQK